MHPKMPVYWLMYDFHEMHAWRQTTMLTLILPDIHSWADETAEPRPDINIKVAAFTVIQK